LLSALLAGSPLLAPRAVAQQPSAIRASAYVTTSVLAARLRSDSAALALRVLPPATERVRIAGVGTLDIQAGPGEVVRVSPRVEDSEHQGTVVVQVCTIGS
jgi:hypothetical protein